MTKAEMQKIEKLAAQSEKYAKQSLAKSEELRAYLSLLEYKQGKVNRYKSVDDLYKKLKLT